MTRATLSRFAPALVVMSLLVGLAFAGSAYNVANPPPRSVFMTLPDDLPEPQITLRAERLNTGHLRLTLEATAFQFTDICVSDAKAIPVGHAHVIHNGVKVASAFQPLIDLEPLAPGTHRISVILQSQDHRALLGREGLIKADLVITVPPVFVGT